MFRPSLWLILAAISLLVIPWCVSYGMTAIYLQNTWSFGLNRGRVWHEGGWNMRDYRLEAPAPVDFGTPGGRPGTWLVDFSARPSGPINAYLNEGDVWPIIRLGPRWCFLMPFWIPVAVLCVPLPFLFVRPSHSRQGRCPHCGYDLRSTMGDRCPECGRPDSEQAGEQGSE